VKNSVNTYRRTSGSIEDMTNIPNDLLAGDQEGRAKKWVAKYQARLRPPFLSPEAGR